MINRRSLKIGGWGDGRSAAFPGIYGEAIDFSSSPPNELYLCCENQATGMLNLLLQGRYCLSRVIERPCSSDWESARLKIWLSPVQIRAGALQQLV
jgi:hypothetical protein